MANEWVPTNIGLFGPQNPYLPTLGLGQQLWQQQWFTESATTSNVSPNCPPLTLTSDDYKLIAKAKDGDCTRVQGEPCYQPFVPDSQKSKAFMAAERAYVDAVLDPNDWTAWPVTKSLVAWYRRTDKVEFWASVVIVGYYVAHCVLGVL